MDVQNSMEIDPKIGNTYSWGDKDHFRILQLYSIGRMLFLILSHAIGPLAIISAMKQNCGNALKIIIILLCGIFLKSYSLLEIDEVSERIKRNGQGYNQCIDFNPLSVLITGVTGLVIIICICETWSKNKRTHIFYQNASLVCIGSVSVYISYLYATSNAEKLQLPIWETKSDIFYISVCLINPFEYPLPLVMEYGLIIPFSIFIITYSLRKRSDGKPRMLLTHCQKNEPMVCHLCSCINDCFSEILLIYAMSYLAFRPAMLLHSYIYGASMRDLVPPLVNIIIHLGISFKCVMVNFHQRKLRSSEIKSSPGKHCTDDDIVIP